MMWLPATGTLLFAEVFVAAVLFIHGLPHRDRLVARIACVLAVSVAYSALVVAGYCWLSTTSDNYFTSGVSSAWVIANCAIILLATIPSLLLCFRATIWSAVFCAVCGYALQNFGSGLGELVTVLAGAALPTWLSGAPLTASCCVVTYVCFYLLLIRRVNPAGLEGEKGRALVAMVFVTVFAVIGFDVVLKRAEVIGLPLSTYVPLRLIHGLVCVFVLVVNVELAVNGRLASEKAATERILAERERQYAVSRENIGAINARVHEIRHEVLRTLSEADSPLDKGLLADVAHEVSIYDSTVRTGNDALDTILTEKSLLCGRQGITLTCIADGSALGLVSSADIYALFGTILDRGIEVARGVGDPNGRSISLVVRRHAGMACVHMECTSGDKIGEDPVSVGQIISRYGGTASWSSGAGTVSLDALIPMGDAEGKSAKA
jgi:hypothetical protein